MKTGQELVRQQAGLEEYAQPQVFKSQKGNLESFKLFICLDFLTKKGTAKFAMSYKGAESQNLL